MLTDQQDVILTFIRRSIDQNGFPPTLREIGRGVGISSTSVVNYHLKKLQKEGYLERQKETARSMAVTGSFSARPGDRVVVELEHGERVVAVLIEPAPRAA